MQWLKHYWPESLLALTLLAIESGSRVYGRINTTTSTTPIVNQLNSGWNASRKLEARAQTRALWDHGFDNYMKHGFPLDELSPLTCRGQGPDWLHPANIARNDVSGNFSLTLIDVVDTFVVLNDVKGFDSAVRNIIDVVRFDSAVKPQVFETTIRVLGGLLSGHIFASTPQPNPFHLDWYDGQLLSMAVDLGNRLLPAFMTPTGIPIARINLLDGLTVGESVETCTAGAASLILEMGTLSRLTNDTRYEKAAYKAFFAIWNRRSEKNLVGNTINAWSGKWLHPEITGIGAGIDSFYEYALKWYIMSGDPAFLDVWLEAYSSIMRYSRAGDGYWFRTVNMNSGETAYSMVDSLSAFFSGLQVLAGDVEGAIKSHLMYWNLWRRHSGIPEVWDINHKVATSFQYPLRPEFVESTWYLYRATRDPFYLDVGERILTDLTYRAKVSCGLAGIQDLRTNQRDDRMESFALSETLKYLYLLFDEENALHRDDSNYVFTTEGHILKLDPSTLRPISATLRKMRGKELHSCPEPAPAYASYHYPSGTGLVQGMRARPDADYARFLGGMPPQPADEYLYTPYGWCSAPKVDIFSYDFVLSYSGTVSEDLKPGSDKISPFENGYLILNVTGLRAHITSRLDGRGYDVTKIGPYSVRAGQTVYINDTGLFASMDKDDESTTEEELVRKPASTSLKLRFRVAQEKQGQPILFDMPPAAADLVLTAYTAFFGGDLTSKTPSATSPLRMAHKSGVKLDVDFDNLQGCNDYSRLLENEVVVVTRGNCTFLEKLTLARNYGASGVLVISDRNDVINPTTTKGELLIAGDVSDAVCLVLKQADGRDLADLMANAVKRASHVVVTMEEDPFSPDAQHSFTDRDKMVEPKEEVQRFLYINGHALLNTRLLI